MGKLEATSSRNTIIEILAELLKKADSREIDKICYLTLGMLAPAYENIEFNLAEKLMIRVLAKTFEEAEDEVKKLTKKMGDLGDVAAELGFKKKREGSSLSVNEVYDLLYEVAVSSGAGSVEKKIALMTDLLHKVDYLSARYLVRIPLGKLRLGFSELTIMDALSWMLGGDKSKRVEIEEAFNVRADIGEMAKLLKLKGLGGLKGMKVALGKPVMPALCQRLPSTEEIIKKMGKVAVEPKYDGTRLQIHASISDKFVKIFTRNLENVTEMFPDLVEAVTKEIKAKSVVLDGEAVGYDPKTGKFLPFQETIKRKRKYEILEKIKEIPLKYFCFDILHKDGKDLISTPFNERRETLTKIILPPDNKSIVLSPQIVTDQADEIRKYHHEQKRKGLEGVVIKKWESPYEPGRRGYSWVKLKEEKGKKGGGLTDTVDCVVMGYNRGKGKRAGFGIGAFLVGIRKSEKTDEFLTISKIGTGLSDEQWREMKQRSEKWEIEKKPVEYTVDKNLEQDVWLKPKIVVEIEADNITKSPIHSAGFALRFPRLVRFRDDKSPQEATTLSEVEKLYKLQ